MKIDRFTPLANLTSAFSKEVLPRLLCNRFLKPTLSFWPYCARQEKWKDWNRKSGHLSNTTFLVATRFFHSEWRQAYICAYFLKKIVGIIIQLPKEKCSHLFSVAFPEYRSHLCFISANYSCATWAAMGHVLKVVSKYQDSHFQNIKRVVSEFQFW